MKKTSNKHLRIVKSGVGYKFDTPEPYLNMLGRLANAEATLVAAGIDSAMPHFIAVVKEIECVLGISFEMVDLDA